MANNAIAVISSWASLGSMTHVLKIGRGVSAARAHEESGKSKQAAEEPVKDAGQVAAKAVTKEREPNKDAEQAAAKATTEEREPDKDTEQAAAKATTEEREPDKDTEQTVASSGAQLMVASVVPAAIKCTRRTDAQIPYPHSQPRHQRATPAIKKGCRRRASRSKAASLSGNNSSSTECPREARTGSPRADISSRHVAPWGEPEGAKCVGGCLKPRAYRR